MCPNVAKADMKISICPTA